MKKRNWCLLAAFLVLLILGGWAPSARAGLSAVGPTDLPSPPGNGYPFWYQDATGMTLDLCLPKVGPQVTLGACGALVIPNPSAPISFPGNFPDESFYFLSSSVLVTDTVTRDNAVLVLALEGAFATGVVSPGAQITFSRLRIVVDAPVAGNYTVTTPYGVYSFSNVAVGRRAIVFPLDIGVGPGVFTGALAGTTGPFLEASLTPGGAPLAPVTIAGDTSGDQFLSGGALTNVTGSPANTNYFQICTSAAGGFPNPPATPPGTPAGCIRVNDFTLTGRIFNGTPFVLNEAYYERNALGAGTVNVFATTSSSSATASYAVSGAGLTGENMTKQATTRNLFSSIPFTAGTTLPVTVTVTATDPGVPPAPPKTPTVLSTNLVDLVTITQASYVEGTQTLTINAFSSDQAAPLPTLTATGLGTLVNGVLIVPNLLAPPVSVTVTSSKGGTDTALVAVGVPPAPVVVTESFYLRDASGAGTVNVFATTSSSSLTAIYTVSGAPLTPANMAEQGHPGTLFVSIPFTTGTTLPATVTITLTDPPAAPTVVSSNLVDLVTITKAVYYENTLSLIINAFSSDQAPSPTLTATGLGTLVNGVLVVPNVLAPPGSVTVTSSKGGTDTEAVTVGVHFVVNESYYVRDASGAGTVNVFATTASSSATDSYAVSGAGLTGEIMTEQGAPGNLFASIPFTTGTTLPATVTVTATDPGKPTTVVSSNLVDLVTITKAVYDEVARSLTINAFSSDQALPPTLTATGLGALVNGVLIVPNLLTPPGFVTVTSSKRGTDTAPVTPPVIVPKVLNDFDKDRKTDIAVWRGLDSSWHILHSSGGETTVPWGILTDKLVPGDYDGDGRTDIAIWRPGEGKWYIKRSSDGVVSTTQWGLGTAPYNDIPVPGDYDGDGKIDLAVWRPGEGKWYFKRSSDGVVVATPWGLGAAPYNDVPVPGDYDGDGKTDLAVWRPGEGNWYIKRSSDGVVTVTPYGLGTAPINDIPVPGDYDGDGKIDIAVYRPGEGNWYILPSGTGVSSITLWGGDPTDVPISSIVR